MTTLRIATRKSPLALWQAEEVKRLLLIQQADLNIELVELSTQGDQILDQSLSKLGGKGLFVKELEHALYDNKADIAVHSMKDVPMELPEGLRLAVVLERDDPRDAFVSNLYSKLSDLAPGAVVGTGSLRRKMQLNAHYPSLVIKELRGNVGTRLAKLDQGDYDAIILAAAGLNRLGLKHRIASSLSIKESLPAIGQAAIGIECRVGDCNVEAIIAPLEHQQTSICVCAERALNQRLHGGCHFPIAGFAQLLDQERILLQAMIGNPDGSEHIFDKIIGPSSNPEQLGITLADQLLEQGGDALLSAFRANPDYGQL